MAVYDKENLEMLEKKKIFEKATTLKDAVIIYNNFIRRLKCEQDDSQYYFYHEIKKRTTSSLMKAIDAAGMRESISNAVYFGDHPIGFDLDLVKAWPEDGNIIFRFGLSYTYDLQRDTYYGFRHGHIIQITIPENNIDYDNFNYDVESIRSGLVLSYYNEEEKIRDYFYKNKKMVYEFYQACINELSQVREEKENFEKEITELENTYPIELADNVYAICEIDEPAINYYGNVGVTKIVNTSSGKTIVDFNDKFPKSVWKLKINRNSIPGYIQNAYSMGIDEMHEEYKKYQLTR